MQQETQNGHSENFFGAYRDHWWNRGFLDLMAKRLDLGGHRRLLDVGCGQCSWSKLLLPYLAKPAEVYAVDNDTKWSWADHNVEDFFKHREAHFELHCAHAESLPFEDDFFDIVTCQTLLIHVENPELVLFEMKRVLRPGGTILCVEPNNMVQNLVKNSLSAGQSIEEILDHVKYALICESGKKKLGQGDNSLGDLLPGLLAESGFRRIEVRLSDKAIPMYPPYRRQEQMATIRQWAQGSSWQSDENDDRDYFLAAGEEYLGFYEYYHRKYQFNIHDLLRSLESEDYHAAGGAMMYLVSGIK